MYWFHPRHVEGWNDAHVSAQFELNYHWIDNLLDWELINLGANSVR